MRVFTGGLQICHPAYGLCVTVSWASFTSTALLRVHSPHTKVIQLDCSLTLYFCIFVSLLADLPQTGTDRQKQHAHTDKMTNGARWHTDSDGDKLCFCLEAQPNCKPQLHLSPSVCNRRDRALYKHCKLWDDSRSVTMWGWILLFESVTERLGPDLGTAFDETLNPSIFW